MSNSDIKNFNTLKESEIRILGIVSRLGQADIDLVMSYLDKGRSLSHTHVVKILQDLVDKKYLLKSKIGDKCIYINIHDRKDILKSFLEFFFGASFSDDCNQLLSYMISSDKYSSDELEKIRSLMEQSSKDSQM